MCKTYRKWKRKKIEKEKYMRKKERTKNVGGKEEEEKRRGGGRIKEFKGRTGDMEIYKQEEKQKGTNKK